MENTTDLLIWVTEYGIEDDIKNVLIDEGYDSTLKFVRQWFDGWGEAEAILEYYT